MMDKNTREAMFSHERSDWNTPDWLRRYLYKKHRITCDPAPADHKEDWLAPGKHWGARCYINPPYNREIPKWLTKAIDEMELGNTELCVFLLPARTDTKWFHEIVIPRAMSIEFIKGRLKFSGHHNSAPFPSMLVIFERYHLNGGYKYITARTFQREPITPKVTKVTSSRSLAAAFEVL